MESGFAAVPTSTLAESMLDDLDDLSDVEEAPTEERDLDEYGGGGEDDGPSDTQPTNQSDNVAAVADIETAATATPSATAVTRTNANNFPPNNIRNKI